MRHENPHKDSLVINGRRYGAHTGKPLDGLSHPSRQVTHPDPAPHHTAARAAHHVDGIAPRHRAPHKAMAAHTVHHRAHPTKPHSAHADQNQHHIEVHGTSKSAHQTKHHTAKSHHQLKLSSKIDEERAARARRMAHSAQIVKFAPFLQENSSKKPSRSDHHQAPTHHPVSHRPEVAGHPTAPLPATKPDLKTIADMLTSAPKPEHKRRGRRSRILHPPRRATAASAVLATLAIIGYIAYLNIPNLSLRVAATRAGVTASLPGYKPSGFDFNGPITYSPGSVVLSYQSESDGARSYRISQEQSDWDSQSLLENYVNQQTDDPHTFQQKGLTIYIYDDTHATWVNHGIWYRIEGNSFLDTEQLLKIAASF